MLSAKQYIGIACISILGIAAGFGLYFFARSYKNTQEVIRVQQKNLAVAQQEIAYLLGTASSSMALNQQEIIQQKQSGSSLLQTVDTNSIQASDLIPYESGVLQINCGDVLGSASLWNIPGVGYAALTNFHVIADNVDTGASGCVLMPDPNVISGAPYDATVLLAQDKPWNTTADEAVLPISGVTNANNQENEAISSLNYNISSLPKCSPKMPLNTPVVTLGFPAYAIQTVDTSGSDDTQASLITSNGVISGYDDSAMDTSGLPYLDYYVSAKIDSGNSGGIAFSKDSQGLCILGIPTWISTGNYENEGVVQNIDNITYTQR